MKYKIGDYVIIIGDYCRWNCIDRYRNGKGFKNEIGKIIDIGYDYRIEFLNCPHKNKCTYYINSESCIFAYENEIKSINSLKLKKFIQHGI